jgi:hypothetical protein
MQLRPVLRSHTDDEKGHTFAAFAAEAAAAIRAMLSAGARGTPIIKPSILLPEKLDSKRSLRAGTSEGSGSLASRLLPLGPMSSSQLLVAVAHHARLLLLGHAA